MIVGSGEMMSAPAMGVARCHHLLGRVMEWCGWSGGAVSAYRDALQADPGLADAHFRMGEALGRRGQWQEASEAFAQAAQLRPKSLEAQGSFVLALARAGLSDALVVELRRLTQLRPQEAELFMLLGAVLRRLGRQDEAIRAFRWAVRLRAAPPAKRLLLGEALLGAKGWQDVQRSWGEARALQPREELDRQPVGHSALHDHPGLPLEGAGSKPGLRHVRGPFGPLLARFRRIRDGLEPHAEPAHLRLEREERTRSILHGYREPRSFPVQGDGDRATVYFGAAAARERKKRADP
jgi:tetratricopeptide (TPR) repeat protein